MIDFLLPLSAAVLIGAGVYLLLSRALIKLIVGLSLFSYGANLSILIAGSGTNRNSPPLVNLEGPFNDPLPQALILTAIVIGFGTTALLLVLATRAYQVTGTDHVQELVEVPDPVEPPLVYADPEHPSVSPERGAPADRARLLREQEARALERAEAGSAEAESTEADEGDRR